MTAGLMSFESLVGAGAFEVMGAVTSALKQIERAVPELRERGLISAYRREAMSGSYEELLALSYRTLREWAPTTYGISTTEESEEEGVERILGEYREMLCGEE